MVLNAAPSTANAMGSAEPSGTTDETGATDRAQRLATALVASGGDLQLVAERLNSKLPPNTPPISQSEILEAFIYQATTDSQTQNSVKALIMLNLLTMLTSAKDQLMSAMPDFSPGELINTIRIVVEGIASFMPPPAAAPSNTQVNILQQFQPDQARERIEARLLSYSDAANDLPPPPTQEQIIESETIQRLGPKIQLGESQSENDAS